MKIDASSVLVVAAHPDDEALGCGGTIAGLVRSGARVNILFLADGTGARGPEAEAARERRANAERAATILGALPPRFLDFPDNGLDSVPLLKVVQAIEAHAATLRSDCVFTHHLGDLNIDHRVCAEAVLTAFRPFPAQTVRSIFSFEVLSSTDWAPEPFGPFSPNVFIDITDTLAAKQAALQVYADEMRCWPHARSFEAVTHLARSRGASVGLDAAEAFKLLRSIYSA
jgi:LmbE family N-acetylglucosaminyl deacetylase